MQNSRKEQIKKRRIVCGILAFLCATVIFILSSIPASGYPSHPGFLNYIAHFTEYLVFSALITAALLGGRLKPWQAVLLAILVASVFAATDEFHQFFVPGRLSDPLDWLTDTVGAIVGALLACFVLKKRSEPESYR